MLPCGVMHNLSSTTLLRLFVLSSALLSVTACSTQDAPTANKSATALSNANTTATITTDDKEPKLTLASDACISIHTLIDTHLTEVESLCSPDGLVAKDIARNDQGCAYGEVRSLTLACFAPSPNDPTPPELP